MINIRTVKKVERYENFVKEYLKSKGKNYLTPDEQKYIKSELGYCITNDDRSNVELYYFMKERPKKYFLYINEEKRTATTWTGEKLGTVYMGSTYTSNFGDKRRNIDVIGINGIKYHGTFYKSSGDYARVIAYKKQ